MHVAILARGIAVSALALFSMTAHAQGPADFYKGKTVDLMIGYSVGGGYDVYARMIARHLGKHIPGNPTVVPKNMEGAGSLRLANWLYNVAAKDGAVLGTIGRGTGKEKTPALEIGRSGGQLDFRQPTAGQRAMLRQQR